LSKDDTRYTYAVSRIRALENRLLDRNRIESMLEAKTHQDVLKILSETDYAEVISEMRDDYDYERALATERQNIVAMLKKISPEPDIINLLILRYDFHNLKVLLKAKYLEESADHLLVDAGSVDSSEMKKIIEEENFRELPPFMRAAAESAMQEFHESEDPQIISFILDKQLYESLVALAKEHQSDFLTRYFRVQIDLTNISAFLRVKNLNKDRNFMENVLLDHGSIEKQVFIQLFMEPEPADALIAKFLNSDYASIIETGVKEWTESHSTTYFEKLADNYLLNYAKTAKMIVFGVEPLLAYLLAKEIEIRIIRMIMVGKLNDIPPEEIRERLRDVYA